MSFLFPIYFILFFKAQLLTSIKLHVPFGTYAHVLCFFSFFISCGLISSRVSLSSPKIASQGPPQIKSTRPSQPLLEVAIRRAGAIQRVKGSWLPQNQDIGPINHKKITFRRVRAEYVKLGYS